MKKIFTLLSAALMSLAVSAKDYTCNLAVELNGQPAENGTKAELSCSKGDNGKYEIMLKDFNFAGMPVGDINIKDINAVEDDGDIHLSYNGNIIVTGMPGIDLPGTLEGYIFDDVLAIRLQLVAGDINVNVAAHNMRTQIPGADFENWHKTVNAYGTEGDEPNGWHGIISGTGLAMLSPASAGISDEVREGATGKYSAKLFSTFIDMGFVQASGNGTITTGRMSVGSTKPTDPCNNSFIPGVDFDAKLFQPNMSSDDPAYFEGYNNPELKDANGDPYFCALPAYPTSISLWYKFKNGDNNDKPAMINCALVGEGYYQDTLPSDDYVFENKVAGATSNLPATDEWKQITVPFEYVENSLADPANILVTINTCKDAGGGSNSYDNPDVLLVDDVTLNYEPVATEIEFYNEDNDESVTVKLSAGKDTYDVGLNFIPTDEDIDIYCGNEEATALTYYDEATKTLTVNMYNAELKYIKTYKFNIVDPAGINGVESNGSQVVKSRYNVSGQKVGKNARGLIITKYSDGTVKKSFK